jgi:hypothetical protein
MARFPETDKDIENVEAWAEVIEDVLFRVSSKQRAQVLALVTAKEQQARKDRETNPLGIMSWAEIRNMDTPGLRHWNAIMRLKSLVVQAFVRDITIDHSPQDAARILFAGHPHGTGSGLLEDYLPSVGHSKGSDHD